MTARHRRPRLPSLDGRFAGLALVLLNVFGLAFVVYGAGTTAAAVTDLPHGSVLASAPS